MAGIDVTLSRRYYMYYKCPYCGCTNMEQEEFPFPSAVSEQKSNRPAGKRNKYARMIFGDRNKASELEIKQKYYKLQINEYHNFEELALHCTCEKCGREQPWSAASRPGRQVMSVTFGILMGAGAALMAFAGSFALKIAGAALMVISLLWLYRNTAARRKLVREVNSLSPGNFPVIVMQDNYDEFMSYIKAREGGGKRDAGDTDTRGCVTEKSAGNSPESPEEKSAGNSPESPEEKSAGNSSESPEEKNAAGSPGSPADAFHIPGVSSQVPNPRYTEGHMMLGQLQSLCIMLGITFCILAGCMGVRGLSTVPIEYEKFTAQSEEDDHVYADITYFLPIASVTSTRGGLGSGKDGYFFYCTTSDEENIFLFIDRSLQPAELEEYLGGLDDSLSISSFYQPDKAVRIYGRAEKIRDNAKDAPQMVLGQIIINVYADPPRTVFAFAPASSAAIAAALGIGLAFLAAAAGLQVRYRRSVRRGGN